MQPTYRWHGTPERTGSLFFVPQLGPPMQRSRQPVLLGGGQEVGVVLKPHGRRIQCSARPAGRAPGVGRECLWALVGSLGIGCCQPDLQAVENALRFGPLMNGGHKVVQALRASGEPRGRPPPTSACPRRGSGTRGLHASDALPIGLVCVRRLAQSWPAAASQAGPVAGLRAEDVVERTCEVGQDSPAVESVDAGERAHSLVGAVDLDGAGVRAARPIRGAHRSSTTCEPCHASRGGHPTVT